MALSKALAVEGNEEIQELRAALRRSQKELAKTKQRTDMLVEATIQAAKDATLALGKIAPVPAPRADKRRSKAEHALWHLTDWQGAKVTPTYNTEVMRQRVMLFCDKAARLTEIQRAAHPVKEVTIMFGGDMVEGLFNYPAQLHQIDATLFDQYVTVSRLIVDVIRRALSIYDKVNVVAEWGNHGRIGSKRDDVPKSDNVDRMCYEFARQLLLESGETRLNWQFNSHEDIQQVEVGNYRALLLHGDEVGRMGFASPAAWQAAGNRWRAGAYKWEFQDIYVGHFHKHAQEPLSDGFGAIYWTGSTESDNRYARDSMAASGVPSQRLHFVDPVKGRITSQYQVWLDA